MTEIINISKISDSTGSLCNVSLELSDKKIHGIFGSERSGVLTLSRLVSGISYADGGEITVRGQKMSAAPDVAKALVGYLPCGAPVYRNMTVEEYLLFVAEAKGISGKSARTAAVAAALERCGIDCISEILTKKLSQEARVRIGIAAATLGSPDVIVLEEPLFGLSSDEAADILKLIGSLKRSLAVALFCQSDCTAIDLCDRVTLICDGQVTYRTDIFNDVHRSSARDTVSSALGINTDVEVAKK